MHPICLFIARFAHKVFEKCGLYFQPGGGSETVRRSAGPRCPLPSD